MKLTPGKLYQLKRPDCFYSLDMGGREFVAGTIFMFIEAKSYGRGKFLGSFCYYFLTPDGEKVEGLYEASWMEEYLKRINP